MCPLGWHDLDVQCTVSFSLGKVTLDLTHRFISAEYRNRLSVEYEEQFSQKEALDIYEGAKLYNHTVNWEQFRNMESLYFDIAFEINWTWHISTRIPMWWDAVCSFWSWWGFCLQTHDDVIKWKHFLRYWPFVRRIHRSPVNSPHKGQWRGALMFSLICVWINGWVNNREAGVLRRYRAYYDATVMIISIQLGHVPAQFANISFIYG